MVLLDDEAFSREWIIFSFHEAEFSASGTCHRRCHAYLRAAQFSLLIFVSRRINFITRQTPDSPGWTFGEGEVSREKFAAAASGAAQLYPPLKASTACR